MSNRNLAPSDNLGSIDGQVLMAFINGISQNGVPPKALNRAKNKAKVSLLSTQQNVASLKNNIQPSHERGMDLEALLNTFVDDENLDPIAFSQDQIKQLGNQITAILGTIGPDQKMPSKQQEEAIMLAIAREMEALEQTEDEGLVVGSKQNSRQKTKNQASKIQNLYRQITYAILGISKAISPAQLKLMIRQLVRGKNLGNLAKLIAQNRKILQTILKRNPKLLAKMKPNMAVAIKRSINGNLKEKEVLHLLQQARSLDKAKSQGAGLSSLQIKQLAVLSASQVKQGASLGPASTPARALSMQNQKIAV